MITTFKIFERLGIDNTILKISEKIYSGFLENYNKEKEFTNSSDTFYTDITDLKKEFNFKINQDKIECKIKYNTAESSSGVIIKIGYTIQIGVIDLLSNDKIKKSHIIKGSIIHEVQHMIYVLRTYMQSSKTKTKTKETKYFINKDKFKEIFYNDLMGSFSNTDSNTYGMKISLINFMKCDLFTEQYKKIIAYFYLADKNEMMSRLHEFLSEIKNLKNVKDIDNSYKISFYKDMLNFKIDINSCAEKEKNNLARIFNPKDAKRVESYFNNKSKTLIRKIHKLADFRTE